MITSRHIFISRELKFATRYNKTERWPLVFRSEPCSSVLHTSWPGAHGGHPLRLAGLCAQEPMLSVLSQALCALSTHQWGISKTIWSLLCRAKELGWWKKDWWQHGLTWFLPIICKDEPVVRKYLQKGPFCFLKSFWISYTLVQWVGLQRRNMTRQFFPTLSLRIYVCPDPCFNHP